MKRIILTSSALFCIIISAKAQFANFSDALFDGDTSKNKVEKLFETNADELNIHFQTPLNNGVSLMFEYSNVGLWKGVDTFSKPLETATEQLKFYADSLKRFANSRRLDIYENGSDKIISRYRQSESNNNLRIAENGQLKALKMNNDTLRIVLAFADKKMYGTYVSQRFQYTFIMKDLNSFSAILQDKQWIMNTAHVLDSVMAVYKEKWRKPDADYHLLYIKQNPQDSTKPLVVKKRPISGFVERPKFVIVEAGVGMSLVRNTLCPNAYFGEKILLDGDESGSAFIRISINTFNRYEEQSDQKFKAYQTSFVNAELGLQSFKSNTYGKDFLLSIGFGYKLPLAKKQQFLNDPSMDINMYKLFFNYGLSRNITLQPEFVTNFNRKENNNGWFGITINFRIY